MKLLRLTLAFCCIASPLQAADVLATASAEIVSPVSVSQITPMSFGTFAPHINPATNGFNIVTMDTMGIALGVDYTDRNISPGKFQVSGIPYTGISVTCDSEFVLSGDTGGSIPISITQCAPVTQTIHVDADLVIVQARFTTVKNPPVGNYSGSYTLNINY